jgi:3,8-divinyl chlorophyllide a/chlorophyllide a reductase subunit Y
MPRSTAPRWPAIHPFYTASVREFETAGRSIVPSAPVGHDGTEAWLQAVGRACNVPQAMIDAAKNKWLRAIKGALAAMPIKGRITVSGYEGSELLVARLLIESGADVPYVGSACPKTPWSGPDLEWLQAKRRARAVPRLAGAGHRRGARIPARPGHRHHAGGAGRQAGHDPGAVLHQPDLGAPADGPDAGAGSLAQVVNAAIANKARFDQMREFFGDVGRATRPACGKTCRRTPRVPRRDETPGHQAPEAQGRGDDLMLLR